MSQEKGLPKFAPRAPKTTISDDWGASKQYVPTIVGIEKEGDKIETFRRRTLTAIVGVSTHKGI